MDNHLYQFSLLNALMDGVSESGVSVASFQQKGNQGLGTFSRMDGELVLLDGVVYKLQAHGQVSVARPDEQIPYGVAIHLVPHETRSVELPDKASVDHVLDHISASRATNLFLAYRIVGRFRRLTARTVRGQQYRGQPLSELKDHQYVNDYADLDAVVVGFRSPSAWQGFAVAGEHLHFISADRTSGGHVLDLQSDGPVSISFAVASHIHVELPTTDDFNAAPLKLDVRGIERAEG